MMSKRLRSWKRLQIIRNKIRRLFLIKNYVPVLTQINHNVIKNISFYERQHCY